MGIPMIWAYEKGLRDLSLYVLENHRTLFGQIFPTHTQQYQSLLTQYTQTLSAIFASDDEYLQNLFPKQGLKPSNDNIPKLLTMLYADKLMDKNGKLLAKAK